MKSIKRIEFECVRESSTTTIASKTTTSARQQYQYTMALQDKCTCTTDNMQHQAQVPTDQSVYHYMSSNIKKAKIKIMGV